MVEFYDGDIFKAPVDIIIHQANCFNTMNKGVAAQIKKRYPKAALVDKETKKGDLSKLGTFTTAQDKGKMIINLYGQYNYGRGRHTNYLALAQGFAKVSNWLHENKNTDKVIGIPFGMGAGLGGGNWNVIASIIDTIFGDTKVRVLICKY